MRSLQIYWETNYVGFRIQNIEPRFPITMWNAFQRTLDGLSTTNNSLGAWHKAFQNSIDCHNPSLQKLVQQIMKEYSTAEQFLIRYRAGYRLKEMPQNKYVQKARRIKTLLENYSFRNFEQHINSITYNLFL